MNDLIPTTTDLVSHLLKQFREGDWTAIAASAAPDARLVDPCYLAAAPRNDAARASAVQATIHWAIDKLKPRGQRDWFAKAWRHFNVLDAYYVQRLRVADVAERLGIAEVAVQYRRLREGNGMGDRS